jgi:thiol-disulfide isomerase/thioredoxin
VKTNRHGKVKNGKAHLRSMWAVACFAYLLLTLGAGLRGQQRAARLNNSSVAPQQSGPADMIPDAADFDLKDLQGKSVHLSDFKGKAVVLNFWATWCVPCKEEMPWLISFQRQYGPQGLVILGLAMDDPPAKVHKYAQKMGVNYSVLLANQAVADKYYVKGLPATIYIDRRGRITDQVPGLAPRSFMENEIQLALASGASLEPRK